MYVVERPEQAQAPHDTVYELVGGEDEVNSFKLNIGKLALAEAKMDGTGQIYEAEVDFFIHFFRSNRILAAHRDIFERLVEIKGTDELYRWLDDDIKGAQDDGRLTTDEAETEKESLMVFHPSGSGIDITWLKPNGISGDFYEGQFQQWDMSMIDDREADEITPEANEIMKKLGLTHDNSQYELIWDRQGRPLILSDRKHLSLGVVEDGVYRALVTILSDDHPARQSQGNQD